MAKPKQDDAGGWALGRRLLAGAFSIGVFLLALFVLHRAIGRTDLAQVLSIATGFGASELMLALGLALASYVALGGFDWLGLHHIRRPLPVASTLLISFVSHAVSHNAGFAVLTGGSVRLRMYSSFGLGMADVAGIVTFAGLTFALGVGVLAAAAFILEGERLAPLLHLPPAVVDGVGWAGAALVGAYFLWAGLARRPLAIHGWRLATPSLPLALGQMLVAATDLALVAGALYVLLPMEGTGIGYAAFVGIYVVATTAGTLSHVPGGLGVFEGALTLLIPAPPAQILAALLIFRVFYNLVPLGLAALVLTVYEIVQRLRHGDQPGWAVGLGPQVAAVLCFVCGMALLWPAGEPPTDITPWIAHMAHLLSGAVAGLLLALPWQLNRRSRWAYAVALATLAAACVLALIRGPHWVLAGGLAFAAAAFSASAPLFDRRPDGDEDDGAVPWGWLGAALAVVVVTAWLNWLHSGLDGLKPTAMAMAALAAAAWKLRQNPALTDCSDDKNWRKGWDSNPR